MSLRGRKGFIEERESVMNKSGGRFVGEGRQDDDTMTGHDDKMTRQHNMALTPTI